MPIQLYHRIRMDRNFLRDFLILLYSSSVISFVDTAEVEL